MFVLRSETEVASETRHELSYLQIIWITLFVYYSLSGIYVNTQVFVYVAPREEARAAVGVQDERTRLLRSRPGSATDSPVTLGKSLSLSNASVSPSVK